MTNYAAIALDLAIADVPNSNTREHWSKTARKRAAIRAEAGALARRIVAQHGATDTPASLVLSFVWPDKRRRDLDNFEAKGLIDGLVDGGLLPDDDGVHLASVTRRVDDGRSDKGRVRIIAEVYSARPEGGE